MNRYYCGSCDKSSYTAMTMKKPKCPDCGSRTFMNPTDKEVMHAKTLASRVGFTNQRRNK